MSNDWSFHTRDGRPMWEPAAGAAAYRDPRYDELPANELPGMWEPADFIDTSEPPDDPDDDLRALIHDEDI